MGKWANVIFIGLLLISLASILIYFMTEGFQMDATTMYNEAIARTGASRRISMPDGVSVCKANTNCYSCVNTDEHPGVNCGWCTAAQVCIPRSGIYRLIPEWLMDMINLDPTKDCPPNSANNQDNFIHTKGACKNATCTDYTNCRECAGASACAWSPALDKCFNKAAMAALKAAAASASSSGSNGSNGSNSGSGTELPPDTVIIDSTSCPAPKCSSITDCGQCTNTTGCGYCKDSSTCISINASGSSLGGSSGSTGCAQGSIYTQIYQCPCSTLTKCTDCAQRPGCGYCRTSKKCITTEVYTTPRGGRLEDRRLVPVATEDLGCDVDEVATSASQCVPGQTIPKGGLDARTAADPTDEELARAQDSGLLGGNELNAPAAYLGATGTGAGAVSPPTTYNTVSGNGVVRRLGDSSIPVTAVDSSTGNPIDNYIKMIVRSQLAAQGVPTNEPFQNLVKTVGEFFGH